MGSRLEGKVAVVTGGGRGIGRQIALLLAEEGASIVVNDTGSDIDGTGTSHAPADQVVEEIRSSGRQAVARYDDVSLMENGESLIQATIDAYGRLDVLVNSVAVIRDGTFAQMTPQEFDLVIRGTVKGTFTPTKYAAMHFRQQRAGRIVNLTSDAGLDGVGRSNYSAASEAIVGLTRTVARDLGKYGVTCNAISSPTWPTPVPDAGDDGRGLGGPDSLGNEAPLAVFLCTGAVPNVNGYVFGVRGGSIFVYSNPSVLRSLHKWGTFTMAEMDDLVPGIMGESA